MNAKPYLSDEEISEICDGLRMPYAQIRYMRQLGLHVVEKPNGRPLVWRSECERVLGAGRLAVLIAPMAQNDPSAGPDFEAARRRRDERRKQRYGSQASRG
jgi:hypothetical protein